MTQARRKTGRSAGPAKAGTHGKYMQAQRSLLAWIPACAGMTLRSLRKILIPYSKITAPCEHGLWGLR